MSGWLPEPGGASPVRGTALIDHPNVEVSVQHGIGELPARGELQVTPADTVNGWLDGAACTKLAVADLTAVSFAVKVDVAPGVGKHAAFDWLWVNTVVGASSVTPEDVAGLIVWLDADAITGLADLDPVASWDNIASGGGSETFSQSTAAARPTYRTNILNGLPAVRFDGSADHLDGATARTLKPATLFAVIKPSSLTGATVLGITASTAGLAWDHASGPPRLLSAETAQIGAASTSLVAGTAYQIDASYASDGAFLFGINGSNDGSGTNNTTINARTCCVGARNSDRDFFAGDLHELLVYNSVLTAGDRTAIRDYLISKWGL